MKKQKTQHELWVEKFGYLVRNCKPMPHPGLAADPNLKSFPPDSLSVCENGIMNYLAPDLRFHFFKMLLNEEKRYWQRKKTGSLLGMGLVCLN